MRNIISLLDTDLYKFTMAQAVFHQFPNLWAEYKFFCRNKDIIFTKDMLIEIEKEIDIFCSSGLHSEELTYLSNLRYIKKDFIELLRLYHPNRDHIKISLEDGKLDITIEGPWFLTIFFEVPILSIINEKYFDGIRGGNRSSEIAQGLDLLSKKIEFAQDSNIIFSDFGTRRRNSFGWHDLIVNKLSEKLPRTIFGGTSNVLFAKKYNLTPIGTMAHEWIMAGQGLDNVSLRDSQSYMFQAWVNEYRGDLGIALSDTLGTDKFLKDFDLYFAKLYDGVRHDSGDPYEWGERIINHYKSLRIDPMTKQLTFSDALTLKKAAAIEKHFRGRAKINFGIGTNLTNDFPNVTPLNIVIKMTRINGHPLAKISDNSGKVMCEDQDFLNYILKICKE